MAGLVSAMQGISLSKPAFFGRNDSFNQTRVARAVTPLPTTMMAKRWIKQPLNANGKPIRIKMHVKKGDTVQVIAGKDKGKVSEVTEVMTKTGKVMVKDVNMMTKHVKPRSAEEAGQIINKEAPIHHSNIMHYSKAKEVRSRVATKVKDDGTKVRVLVKTGEEI
eukprot:CAMPEP_0114250142 /NCGR_PEP_ID=MMETSP0058-20121206/14538_1 /TAXON_ID=36894 /ORGANISM="Pyramimonas parkeae, CCMP726" /LENGTH=163 /DNA_ID=CAMNT_0001363775 /DNA_START=96 /DNA_END=587 /DNA_ORIENTATION=+